MLIKFIIAENLEEVEKMKEAPVLKEGKYRTALEGYRGRLKVADANTIYKNEKSKEKKDNELYWILRAINEETISNINFEQAITEANLLGIPQNSTNSKRKKRR